jgi:acetylornithine deacetylase
LVALLFAFMQLDAEDEGQLPYNLVYLASAEEEVSGRNGIERALPLLPAIDVALVGEPTAMQPAIAEKGLMVLDCTAEGKAGHAAREEGVNAIYKALPDIEWLRSHEFERVSPLLGKVKMSVTQIQAGTQHNVVPDACTFVVDVRTNECYSNLEILEEIQAHLQCKAQARSTRLNSSRIDADHPLIQRCIRMGRVPFGSPTLSDQALMSFPSFKLGPGNSSRSHTADEFICVSELEEALQFYLDLLRG